MPNTERRAFRVELRAKEGAKGKDVCGRAVVFNSLSEDLGGYREMFKPGALDKTLKERNVKALWNHDSNYVLGSIKSGTLSVTQDDDGLAICATPPDTQWARDFIASIERGDVDGMSFAFRAINTEWLDQEIDGKTIWVRVVTEAELYEVSPVAFPAYPETSLSLRDLFGTDDRAEIERIIRIMHGEKPGDETHAEQRAGNTEPPPAGSATGSGNHSAAPNLEATKSQLVKYERDLIL